MKRAIVIILVLGAALAGCWRHVTLVAADAPLDDGGFQPDAIPVDASGVAPVDASLDSNVDAPAVDSSIDAF